MRVANLVCLPSARNKEVQHFIVNSENAVQAYDRNGKFVSEIILESGEPKIFQKINFEETQSSVLAVSSSLNMVFIIEFVEDEKALRIRREAQV